MALFLDQNFLVGDIICVLTNGRAFWSMIRKLEHNPAYNLLYMVNDSKSVKPCKHEVTPYNLNLCQNNNLVS